MARQRRFGLVGTGERGLEMYPYPLLLKAGAIGEIQSVDSHETAASTRPRCTEPVRQ